MNRRSLSLAVAAGLLMGSKQPLLAQESASYKLRESVVNAGGNPTGGAVLTSASYHVKLDAIGDGILATGLASTSFHEDSGFVGAYLPPGEVQNVLVAADKITLSWNPEKSIGTYALYRDLLSALPGSFGTCLQSGLTGTTAIDTNVPSAGQGFFYLVTARNRIAQEGTKGFESSGTERPNPAPCP